MRARGKSVPFYGGVCYACSTKACGYRDRRPEGGALEPACCRHMDPTIPVYHACMYCSGPVRKGSLVIDGEYAHRACHKEASE